MLMLLTFLRAPARSDISKTTQATLQNNMCAQTQLSLCPVDGNSLPNCFLPKLSCACTDVQDPQAHDA
eukprot:12405194-Karenia_brevis.AAC.1